MVKDQNIWILWSNVGIFSTEIKQKTFYCWRWKSKRDFTYVTDVVDAIIKSIKLKKKNQIINIGSGKCYSVNYITKLLGGKKIYIPKRPGEPEITWAKIQKLKDYLIGSRKLELNKVSINF